MSCSFRTSAHGSLTVGYRLATPRRHPTFATDKPAHPAFRSFPLRPAPQSGGESACACGLWLVTDGVCGSAYGSLRCNRVSACCAAPTPDWLFTTSAQCSVKPVPQRLCRARWHTLRRQSAGSSFPFPISPMLSLRSGLSVVRAYPKSCTMLVARQARHRPLNTLPHRLITKSSLEASSRHDFV